MERLKPFFPKSHDRARVDDPPALIRVMYINRDGFRGRDAPREYGPTKSLDNRLTCPPVIFRLCEGAGD